jgi:hypothetical protein
MATPDEMRARWSGGATVTWDTTFPGERRVTAERGRANDQLITYADRARFLLSPDADRIDCLAAAPDDPSWRRFLLDTVLWWTALANGLQILHAGAVELGGGVAVLISHTGGGKSTLAAELLRRGAPLFADDVLAFSTAGGVLAHPGPPVMNLAADREDVGALGTELARLHEGDDERWMRVHRASRSARPPAGLFLYQRGPGLELKVEPAEAGVLELMPFAWVIADDLEGARRRFLAAADLAASTPAYWLTAGLDTPPSEIAELVEAVAAQWTNVRLSGVNDDGDGL